MEFRATYSSSYSSLILSIPNLSTTNFSLALLRFLLSPYLSNTETIASHICNRFSAGMKSIKCFAACGNEPKPPPIKTRKPRTSLSPSFWMTALSPISWMGASPHPLHPPKLILNFRGRFCVKSFRRRYLYVARV